MTAQLIDGTRIAQELRLSVRKKIVENGYNIGLAIILVGNDPASQLYVSLKEKACKEVGINFHAYYLDEATSQEQLHEVIDFLNADPSIHAILVQLPLPDHLNEDQAVARVAPHKDVDGFGPHQLSRFLAGDETALIPGLANGIYALIASTNTSLDGAHALVIANSEIFAQPIIALLNRKGATAEYRHPDDLELEDHTTTADILIVAVGRKWYITPQLVKPDAIIIDVGTNREDGMTYGDVDPAVDEIVAYRSPVPGGVGPMTIAFLLINALQLYEQSTTPQS